MILGGLYLTLEGMALAVLLDVVELEELKRRLKLWVGRTESHLISHLSRMHYTYKFRSSAYNCLMLDLFFSATSVFSLEALWTNKTRHCWSAVSEHAVLVHKPEKLAHFTGRQLLTQNIPSRA